MDTDPLIPIKTPADWNAAKDCEHFEDRWHPDPSYTAALWDWMKFHHGIFQSAVDGAIRCFQRRYVRIIVLPLECLSTLEKLCILREIAETNSLVANFRSQLLSALNVCDFAESERQRVMKGYRLAGDNAWMYPIVKLIDWIGYAAHLLEEAMLWETEGCQDLSEYTTDEDDI